MHRAAEDIRERYGSLAHRLYVIAEDATRSTDERIIAMLTDARLQSPDWRELKRAKEFWQDVTRVMRYIDYEGVNEWGGEGNETFDLSEIAYILGPDKALEISNIVGSSGATQLARITRQHEAKDVFIKYMTHYDFDAAMYFLVLYGRYLFLTKRLTVPVAQALQDAGPDARLALHLEQETRMRFISSLELRTATGLPPTEPQYAFHKYYFRMATNALVFEIQRMRPGHAIATVSPRGLITRVLKFALIDPIMKRDMLCLVLIGPMDRILVRCNLDLSDMVKVVDFGERDLEYVVQDVNYLDMAVRVPYYCPYMRAVNTELIDTRCLELSDLRYVQEVFKFQHVKGAKITAYKKKVTATVNELTPDDYVAFETLVREGLITQLLEAHKIKPEDREALTELALQLRSGNAPEEWSPHRALARQVDMETRKQTQQGGTVEEDIPGLVQRLTPLPALIKLLSETKVPFTDRDRIFQASKIISRSQPPQLAGKNQANDVSRFYLAILYRKQKIFHHKRRAFTVHGDEVERQVSETRWVRGLVIVPYIVGEERNKEEAYIEYDLGDDTAVELSGDTALITIDDFNLVFCNEHLFYVEVLQRSKLHNYHPEEMEVEGVKIHIVDSSVQVLTSSRYMDWRDAKRDVSKSDVPHHALFDAVRTGGFKAWSNGPVLPTSKYEWVFFKYDARHYEGRMLFFKTGTLPTIADVKLPHVTLDDIVSVTPMNSEMGIAQVTMRDGTILRVVRGTGFVDYTPEYTLSASMQQMQQLTLQNTCTFCRAHTELCDDKTRHYYCDTLCQLCHATMQPLL